MIRSEASIIGGALKGILIASIASLIVLGSILISLNEARHPAAINQPTLPIEVTLATPLPPLPTLTPSSTIPPSPTPTPSTTPSLSPTACSPPADWVEYQAQEGDKLRALARRLQIDPQVLLSGNCTEKLVLEPGMTILIPPSQLPTAVACHLATGWFWYVIRHGDTLFSLARSINSSVSLIMNGNCFTTDKIYAGQAILLPRLPPPSLPTATPTMKPLPTDTPLPPTNTVGPISRGTTTPTPNSPNSP